MNQAYTRIAFVTCLSLSMAIISVRAHALTQNQETESLRTYPMNSKHGIDSLFNEAMSKDFGEGSRVTPEKALDELKGLAHAGNAVAEEKLGSYDGLNAHDKRGFYWIRKAALQGNARAEEDMGGRFYGTGEVVSQNAAKSIYWTRKAALQGSVKAEEKLGINYITGFGVPKQNSVKAIYWLQKALHQWNTNPLKKRLAPVDQGYIEDQIGNIYSSGGKGISKNVVEANLWWHKAALRGNNAAAISLGYKLIRNSCDNAIDQEYEENSLKGNKNEFLELKKQAEEINPNSCAQIWIGNYYEAKKEYSQANMYYKSAENGEIYSPEADNDLGDNYFNGHGVPQSYIFAVSWWKKAINGGCSWDGGNVRKGCELAENNLAESYYWGHGIHKNVKKAVSLWSKLEKQGGSVGLLARKELIQGEQDLS